MDLIRPVSFKVENDLAIITGIIEGRIASLAQHKTTGDSDFVRLYFIAPSHRPLVIFDEVPYDLYLEILTLHRITFDDGSDKSSRILAGSPSITITRAFPEAKP